MNSSPSFTYVAMLHDGDGFKFQKFIVSTNWLFNGGLNNVSDAGCYFYDYVNCHDVVHRIMTWEDYSNISTTV